MVWQQWVLVVIYALAALGMVGNIGKHREPLTPDGAAGRLIFVAIIVGLIVSI